MMTKRDSVNLNPLILVLLVAIVVFAVPVVFAQEEPTSVPEPAQEEPAETTAAEPVAEPAAEPEVKEAGVPIVYREKTLITINGRAEMNGYIELIVQPNNEEPTKVRANVVAKTKPKKITKVLVDQLIFGLGDRYKVKQSGDKKIRIIAKKKMPPVSISLKTQNLAGVAVMIGQG